MEDLKNMDQLFITHSKSDYLRILKYMQQKEKCYILEAIGDDWHGDFMIKYRYKKYIKINAYGNIEEV